MTIQATASVDDRPEGFVAPKPRTSIVDVLDTLLPFAAGALFLGTWEFLVHYLKVSKFILPAPSAIVTTFVKEWPAIYVALKYTATITIGAFVTAVVTGIFFGVLLTSHKRIERTFWPYAVTMQVTPVVAIAPLVIIWV